MGRMPDRPDQFDTGVNIVTPENIAFQYQVAGPFRRLPAYLIDLLIRGFIVGVASLAFAVGLGLAGLGSWAGGATLVLWFLLAWFYGGLFETFCNGQTPGKRLMQVRVVSVDGQPINGLQGVLRNLLRVLDGQPALYNLLPPPLTYLGSFILTYLLGLLAATMNDRFQRLGDLASGTMVVVEGRQWLHGLIRTAEPEVRRAAERIPPDFQPSRSLARALAAYVQRRRMFSWGRRLEIARHLGEPLRKKFDLPPQTNLDLLICGLYHRTFITDRGEEPAYEGSPFRGPQAPPAESAERPPRAEGAMVVGEDRNQ